MDTKLFARLNENAPKFNPRIAEGIATEQIRGAERYIDRVFRCAEEGFPEGLEYLGGQRCTPIEEYRVITKSRNNQRSYEITRSDIYLMRYRFSFNGHIIDRHLFLPYLRDSGLLTLRGSTFAVSPVLADKAISVSMNSIFIPLSRAKIKFERIPQHFIRNGVKETVYVIWSPIHNRIAQAKGAENQPSVRAHSTLMHYLFCKVGVVRAFAEYGNSDVVIGYHDTINETNYPPDQWVICKSTNIKPRRLRDRNYIGTDIRLAIPKDQYNPVTASMIGGFFYIADHFPNRVEPEDVDEVRLWKTLLGHLIYPPGVSEGKYVEDIDAHLQSLDNYLDELAKEDLRDEGVYCEDLYDLFLHVIETFSARVSQNVDSVSTMYGKRLTVLRYLLFDIRAAIFNFMFKVSNTKKALTLKDVENAMNRNLKIDLIMRASHRHGEVNIISSPGDNKVFKITSNLVLQTDSSGGKGGKSKMSVTDPSRWLHASIAEVGSYGNLPKSSPDGRGRINPYVKVGPDGLIERSEEHRELLDGVQRMIER